MEEKIAAAKERLMFVFEKIKAFCTLYSATIHRARVSELYSFL